MSKKNEGETGLTTFETLVTHVETGVEESENDCTVVTALEGEKSVEDDSRW